MSGRSIAPSATLRPAARADLPLTTTAERYFPSFGFVPTARDAVPEEVQRSPEFAGVCPSSATVMMRALRSGAGSVSAP
ncbi:MAG TPA: hypothetical protein VMM18_01810 [Gemmatimonadaceae bacterium]|nr:hypothetical protein [Gemmatimonadaceae bacterium]